MADANNCQQVARLLNLVKTAIESADVPIKRSNLLFVLDLKIIFIVSNNIDVYRGKQYSHCPPKREPRINRVL